MATGHQTSALARWTNHAAVPVAIVATLYAGFLVLKLRTTSFDISRFVVAGDAFCDRHHTPDGLSIFPNSDGYDGQFYYRLALNPFSSRPTEYGIRLDNAAYRHQRLIYPLAVWLLTGGNHRLVPLAMVLVNYLGICGMTWLGVQWARGHHMSPLWAILFGMYPGFLQTLSRNLTEITAGLFLLASLVQLQKGRHLTAGILLTVAVLSRETSLIVAVVGLVCGLATRRSGNGNHLALVVFMLPVVGYAVWQVFLFTLWGTSPFLLTVSAQSSIYFGVSDGSFVRLAGISGSLQWLLLVEVTFVLTMLIAIAASIYRDSATIFQTGTWIALCSLGGLMPQLWDEWVFLRALTEAYVAGALLLIRPGSPDTRVLGAIAIGEMWMITFIVSIVRGP
jgi:hypothetical protein